MSSFGQGRNPPPGSWPETYSHSTFSSSPPSYSGPNPKGVYRDGYRTFSGHHIFSGSPPSHSNRPPNSVYSPTQSDSPDVEERRPLLSSRPSQSTVSVSVVKLIAILTMVLLVPICFCVYAEVYIPLQVEYYKGLLNDARAEVQYEKVQLQYARAEVRTLLSDKAALLNTIEDLKDNLHKAKVEAFWEIARTMDTNMYVWVGADDPGSGPKFWSYGITNGRYHNNDPPVTVTQVHFSSGQAAVVESTDQRRVIGYKIRSDRWNNGWWMATGLYEFGQGGYQQVHFQALQGPPHNGAEYDVEIFHAEWK